MLANIKYFVCFIKHDVVHNKFILGDKRIELEKAGTIAISGLDSYHETKRIARLSYAKPGIETKEI